MRKSAENGFLQASWRMFHDFDAQEYIRAVCHGLFRLITNLHFIPLRHVCNFKETMGLHVRLHFGKRRQMGQSSCRKKWTNRN